MGRKGGEGRGPHAAEQKQLSHRWGNGAERAARNEARKHSDPSSSSYPLLSSPLSLLPFLFIASLNGEMAAGVFLLSALLCSALLCWGNMEAIRTVSFLLTFIQEWVGCGCGCSFDQSSVLLLSLSLSLSLFFQQPSSSSEGNCFDLGNGRVN